MSALVAVGQSEQLSGSDKMLYWNIRKIVAVGNVILPEQLSCLFGAIYGAKTAHPVLVAAREEVFRRFPHMKEWADRVFKRGRFDSAADKFECRNERVKRKALVSA
ncbi:hypothetical protein [Acetobacter aceti]|uniref:hypothetical protein n=1 Tax=Acetobacter aceti TaxID=435 RepID=UPI000C07F8B9|nr:hypothetical protein [Acetobacter aceti]